MQNYATFSQTGRAVGAREQRGFAPRAGLRLTLSIFSVKAARTILLVLMIVLTPLVFPRLRRRISFKGQTYRQMLPNPRELISFRRNRAAPSTVIPGANEASSPAASAPEQAIDFGDTCEAQLISDPTRTLDHFYSTLARTDQRKENAITRISHYGDSPITNDGITGTVRRLLQERYGDAGHGFIFIDRPWAWYGHQAITFTSGGDWLSDSFMNPRVKDGEFGLGGVTFRAGAAGAYARYTPASEGTTGRNFSRLEVYYRIQPEGGQFSASVNGNTQTVSTAAATPKSGFFEIKASTPGANAFEVKTLSGNVRLFGAVLENDGPGVVYDSLGVNGAYAGLLKTVMNEQHWAAQLKHRNPDLLILNYGTNESQYASDEQLARYEKDLREVIQRVRAALPGTSILIVSPMDRGRHAPGGKVVTLESIPKIVAMQQRVASDTGCAFFNLFAAMGGSGTMARWHTGKKHLVGADLTHPNAEGGETVGVLIYEALIDGYSKYAARVAAQARKVTQKK